MILFISSEKILLVSKAYTFFSNKNIKCFLHFSPANVFNAFKESTFLEYNVIGAEDVSPIVVKSCPCFLHSFSK